VRLDAIWRFRPRHRADVSYYRLSRDTFRALDHTIEIGDMIFPEGTTVASDLELTIYKASYSYSVVQNCDSMSVFLRDCIFSSGSHK